MRPLALLTLALPLLAGCTDSDGVPLEVDVLSDYRAGYDFDEVRTRLEAVGAEGADERARAVTRNDDFLAGARAASFVDLSPGDYRLEVELRAGDRVVASQRTQLTVDRARLVTVLVASGCAGVACGDEATCVSGACGPLECAIVDTDDCAAICASVADCDVPPAACADVGCVRGQCLAVPDDARCAPRERCDVRRGCVADEPPPSTDGGATGMDAGAPDAGTDAGPPDAGPPDAGPECDPVPRSTDPAVNHARITECLATGLARLGPGDWPVDAAVRVPPDAWLDGDLSYPRVHLTASAAEVVRLAARARVSFLTLDADHFLTGTPAAVARVVGPGALLQDSLVRDGTGPTGDDRTVGIQIGGPAGDLRHVLRCTVENNHVGIVFGGSAQATDRVDDSVVHDNRCDGVQFLGPGQLRGTAVRRNGWDCAGVWPHGVGVRARRVTATITIDDATVEESCGAALDLDQVAACRITASRFVEPGHTFGGAFPGCDGSVAARLVDVSACVLRGNVVANVDGDPIGDVDALGVLNASGTPGAAPTDLPSSASVGMLLAHRPSATADPLFGSSSNVFDDNELRAACTTPCLGVGYFSGRQTGYLRDLEPTPSPSDFTRNDPTGSNVGSVRCGRNRYGPGDPDCTAGQCNTDDDQHEDVIGGANDSLRNDVGCQLYE